MKYILCCALFLLLLLTELEPRLVGEYYRESLHTTPSYFWGHPALDTFNCGVSSHLKLWENYRDFCPGSLLEDRAKISVLLALSLDALYKSPLFTTIDFFN